MEKEQIIKLLQDCSEELFDAEHSRWRSADTMLLFKEWQSECNKNLIRRCYDMINKLED